MFICPHNRTFNFVDKMSVEKDLQEKGCLYVIIKTIVVFGALGIIGFIAVYLLHKSGGYDQSIDYDSKCRQSGPRATDC